MVTKHFEKSNELADLDENWYQGVIWVAEYEFEVKIRNLEMADPLVPIFNETRQYIRNFPSWRVSSSANLNV